MQAIVVNLYGTVRSCEQVGRRRSQRIAHVIDDLQHADRLCISITCVLVPGVGTICASATGTTPASISAPNAA
ncbi:hypothetical protein PXJ20_32710 [Paraburkholderia sp. A1RI_3L]|uniref:hypothetical protein n=1 Tax=Paraburkholderia TaxID=1822464 RepID=UPI003B80D4FA